MRGDEGLEFLDLVGEGGDGWGGGWLAGNTDSFQVKGKTVDETSSIGMSGDNGLGA